MSGVERYFHGWPMVKEKDGALVWRLDSPEELQELLKGKRWHRWRFGCYKLHKKRPQSWGAQC
eukprot:5411942-Pleurochrysis_carterae.AAC.1